MNPLVLLAIGGVAILAMSGKKKREGAAEGESAGNGNGENGLPGVEDQDDYIAEEATVESAGGIVYEARIWRTYEAAADYLGELLVDDEWVGGPMADDVPTVRAGLQEMADSFDVEEGGGASFDQFETDPCEGSFDGPFLAMGYNDQDGWQPLGGEISASQNQPVSDRVWCVVPVVYQGYGMFEGRVVDAQTREVVFKTGPQDNADIAASKAWYGAVNPGGPYPWPGEGGLHAVGTS
jgi:hypothetical protein